ncbi:MAG: hypothetical protein LC753_15970, partial [Acidobacteria bacterium]|nr:hypothetical protein [Acidobacteriota bacterium]
MKRSSTHHAGSTLVVTISVVAGLLVLLAIAVEYTTQISRNTQRSRKTAVAMEIADGHLEYLFTSWRNIYRTPTFTYSNYVGGTDYSLSGTNYFFTAKYNPGPAPTPLPSMSPSAAPPLIPLPPTSNFPTETNYTVGQYRIQAVDPMVNLDANENALVEGGSKGSGGFVPLPANAIPPGAYGPNIGPYGYAYPYSFYYLAAVDVEVPAVTGNVTAKVRRIFEKKFDLPWSYGLFYVDDLELQPSDSFTITGPIHTNASLYIGTNKFTAASPVFTAPSAYQVSPTSGRVEYGADYVNGYSPKDPRFGGTVTEPNFAKSNPSLALSDCPPSQVAAYMPFGWNLTLSAANTNTNDDSYREIVEPASSSGVGTDPLQDVRYYNQARIKIEIKADNTWKVYRPDAFDPRNPAKNVHCTATSDLANDKAIYNLVVSALNTNFALYDSKEGVNVRIQEFDLSKIQKAIDAGNGISGVTSANAVTGFTSSNAVIYIADQTPAYNSDGSRNVISSPLAKLGSSNVSTSERAIRLVNGHILPTTGLTIVTPNPVYIKGNYNTGGTPPSNTTPTSSPVVSTYTRKPSAVIADAINVLSGNWSDAKSTSQITSGGYLVSNPRSATSTTINTAL